MNLETINKWLENEYGVSYTRLEELHDFVIEQDLKHQEEKDKQITQLTNNWNELEESIKRSYYKYTGEQINALQEVLDKMKEIKERNNV